MAEGFVHTLRTEGRWRNEIEGRDGSGLESYATNEEAVAAGRAEAQRRQTDHVVHRADGSIEDRNSYGNDPRHRPG
jgi:hypothetical protein